MRYYLDAAPIIYLVEQIQPFASAVRSRLTTTGLVLVTSELARLECRVKPLRNSDSMCYRISTITLPIRFLRLFR